MSFYEVKLKMSTYTTGQTWGALRKAWKAYKIAKVQNEFGPHEGVF